MKSFQIEAKILSQTRINERCWHCELSAPQIAKTALPGQFINIRVSDQCDPFLRRPLSIHGASGAKIKIFYEVVGKATESLAEKKKGELLDIIGPLGNGFDLGRQEIEGEIKILVVGGMGVVPLIFLAEKLAKVKRQKSKGKAIVLIGAKTKDQLFCVKDFKKLGCAVKIATDNGSSGFKGRVTDLLKCLLPALQPAPCAIYACGPKPMLKAVADIAYERGISAQLSLEEHMSCGIGACLGCAVKTKEGFKRVCKEGPVFNAQDLAW